MRILMIIKWLHNSGAPKMFSWVANGLANQGHDVTVFTFHDYDGSTVTLSPKVRHIHKSLDGVGLIGKIKRIREEVKELKPDVSISFLLDSNVYNIFACVGTETKSVVCERSDPFKPHYYKLKFWKPWFRLADAAVFQLPKVAEFYSNIRGAKIVIPNPIINKGTTNCLPIENRSKKIVTHGRVDISQKRLDILVRAFALLHEHFPDYSLSIFGKDDNPDCGNVMRLKNLASELDIDENVIFEGETLTPYESIKDAKIWVLASDYEGIPNSLIEAMSIGLPCVATDCSPGGARFLINDAVNGYVVARGDVVGLYKKMRYLLENPIVADRIGNEAKKIKDLYSEKQILLQWENFLKQLCS